MELVIAWLLIKSCAALKFVSVSNVWNPDWILRNTLVITSMRAWRVQITCYFSHKTCLPYPCFLFTIFSKIVSGGGGGRHQYLTSKDVSIILPAIRHWRYFVLVIATVRFSTSTADAWRGVLLRGEVCLHLRTVSHALVFIQGQSRVGSHPHRTLSLILARLCWRPCAMSWWVAPRRGGRGLPMIWVARLLPCPSHSVHGGAPSSDGLCRHLLDTRCTRCGANGWRGWRWQVRISARYIQHAFLLTLSGSFCLQQGQGCRWSVLRTNAVA